jgi:hypothetical protein
MVDDERRRVRVPEARQRAADRRVDVVLAGLIARMKMSRQ